MARDVLPAFEPRPHLAIGLLDRRADPRDAQLDELTNRHAALGLVRLAPAQGRGQRRAALRPRRIGRSQRMLGPEFRAVDAQLQIAALPGRRIGEFQGKGRGARRDAVEEKATASAVVRLDPFGNPPLAESVGDDALAPASVGSLARFGALAEAGSLVGADAVSAMG